MIIDFKELEEIRKYLYKNYNKLSIKKIDDYISLIYELKSSLDNPANFQGICATSGLLMYEFDYKLRDETTSATLLIHFDKIDSKSKDFINACVNETDFDYSSIIARNALVEVIDIDKSEKEKAIFNDIC